MRTTITIDDDLLEHLRRRAAESGTTVSRLIEDSVRLAAARPRGAEPKEFKLVTYGRGGRFTSLDVNRTSVLLESEDVERFGRRDR